MTSVNLNRRCNAGVNRKYASASLRVERTNDNSHSYTTCHMTKTRSLIGRLPYHVTEIEAPYWLAARYFEL